LLCGYISFFYFVGLKQFALGLKIKVWSFFYVAQEFVQEYVLASSILPLGFLAFSKMELYEQKIETKQAHLAFKEQLHTHTPLCPMKAI
jgi:hypothetical protein